MLLRVVLGCTLVLVAAELLLRFVLAGPLPYEFDPRYGKVGRPGAALVQADEGYFNGRLNRLGHVDEEPRPPGERRRILVLGDSQTAAREVPLAGSFANRLEPLLDADVENAGVVGWSPVNNAAYLHDVVSELRPSDVVVQLSGGDFDDLQEDHRIHLVRTSTGFSVELPARQLEVGKLRAAARKGMRSSALATHVVRRVGLLAAEQATRLREHFRGPSPPEQPCGALPEQWTVDAVRSLVEDMKADAPSMVALYLPRLSYREGCVDLCARRGDILRGLVAQVGIPLVDPTAALCADFAESGQPGTGFANSNLGEGHFNSRGHTVIARELAAELDRSRL
ncbi:MAG: hypothetical protein A2138_06175 [Deltaproteobacteria bacterium RBG_16_71_12]|nr:MAG: hypothetical protein A2138_06175 [Deltaproteobacteria bacterium RBG_16_71_12]